MVVTLIAKKRESEDGRKWINFSTLKRGKWYNVKFIKDCAPPQVHKVADGVLRAFVDLTADSKFDISPKGNGTIFVETYNPVVADALESAIAAEKVKIDKFREKREKERMDFIAPDEDDLDF